MKKTELDHIWRLVTSALEDEYRNRGWYPPHVYRIEALEKTLREIVDIGEGSLPANWRVMAETMVKIARCALAPEQCTDCGHHLPLLYPCQQMGCPLTSEQNK
jgi:alkanesulfonate monooxygenase SsuD/methylene tetrahydromethanopterin reductase-like flavin-dependent oxidoreductase (luciferase family)